MTVFRLTLHGQLRSRALQNELALVRRGALNPNQLPPLRPKLVQERSRVQEVASEHLVQHPAPAHAVRPAVSLNRNLEVLPALHSPSRELEHCNSDESFSPPA